MGFLLDDTKKKGPQIFARGSRSLQWHCGITAAACEGEHSAPPPDLLGIWQLTARHFPPTPLPSIHSPSRPFSFLSFFFSARPRSAPPPGSTTLESQTSTLVRREREESAGSRADALPLLGPAGETGSTSDRLHRHGDARHVCRI
eukprot:gene12030-8283_t